MPRIKFLKERWGYRPGDVIDYYQDDAEVARLAAEGVVEIVTPTVPRQRTVAVKSMADGRVEDRMIRDAPVERAPEPEEKESAATPKKGRRR